MRVLPATYALILGMIPVFRTTHKRTAAPAPAKKKRIVVKGGVTNVCIDFPYCLEFTESSDANAQQHAAAATGASGAAASQASEDGSGGGGVPRASSDELNWASRIGHPTDSAASLIGGGGGGGEHKSPTATPANSSPARARRRAANVHGLALKTYSSAKVDLDVDTADDTWSVAMHGTKLFNEGKEFLGVEYFRMKGKEKSDTNPKWFDLISHT